jgi:hypothetical protein
MSYKIGAYTQFWTIFAKLLSYYALNVTYMRISMMLEITFFFIIMFSYNVEIDLPLLLSLHQKFYERYVFPHGFKLW